MLTYLIDNAAMGCLVVLLHLACWTLLPLLVGWKPAVVVSGSMAPSIQPGDVVFFQPGHVESLEPGVIVLFDDPSHPGRLLTHRISTRRDDGLFVTKGDANRGPDAQPVRPEAVRGGARLIIPYVGLVALVGDPRQRSRVVMFTSVLVFACWAALPRGRRAPDGALPSV